MSSDVFFERVARRLEELGITERQASLLINPENGKYLSNMRKRKSEPRGTTHLLSIASALKTTPNFLCGLDEGMVSLGADGEETTPALKRLSDGELPYVEQVISWSRRNSGKPLVYGDMGKDIIRYAYPDPFANVPSVCHLGQDALAKKKFKCESTEELNAHIQRLDEGTVSRVMRQLRSIEPGNPVLSHARMYVDWPDRGIKMDFDYVFVYILEKDEYDNPVITNYSRAIA